MSMNTRRYQSKYSRYLEEDPGESRWADPREIEESNSRVCISEGELRCSGLPLISDGDRVTVNSADDHAVIFGSTGSKKTRCIVLPMINMMLRSGESVVCTDPKGELYAATAESAAKLGYEVAVLNFRNFASGDGYNPLSEIYDAYHSGRQDEAMEQIDDIITALAAEEKSSASEPLWYRSASMLGTANLLLLMELADKSTANMSSFTRLCLEDSSELLRDLSSLMSPDSVAGMNYRSVFGQPDRTRMSTQTTLAGMVQPFISNTALRNMLSETTFDFGSVGRKKTAVYIILSDEKPTYYFLVSLFIKQLYERLIREAQQLPGGKLPVRVNYLLEEFGAVPRIHGFECAVTAARSRNIRFYLVLQSLAQLKDRYGQTGAEVIKGNCTDWVFLSSKELPLLNEISELCGVRHGRALISPSELQRLRKGSRTEALILNGRNYPFLAELPDISEYRAFGGGEPAQLPERRFGESRSLPFEELYEAIMSGRERCPFSEGEELADPFGEEVRLKQELARKIEELFAEEGAIDNQSDK